MIAFHVHGLPIAQGSKRVVPTKQGPRVIEGNEAKLRPWRQEVANVAIEMMNGERPFSGPVAVRVNFYLPRPRGHFGTGRNEERLRDSAPVAPATKPDLDKLARALLDALTGVAFHDDSQVVSLTTSKLYADEEKHPGARVEVRQVV